MKVLKLSLILLCVQFWALLAGAQNFIIPPMTAPVIDQASFLNSQDRADLNAVLYEFNSRGTAQVQVLIVQTLGDLDIESASMQVAEKYKLGDAAKDNGILFLVAAQERRLRIEVGQGLEGAIPDAIASRIINDIVVPYFKAGDTSRGIVAGVAEILKRADAEFPVPEKMQKKSLGVGKLILYIIFFVLFLFFSRFSGPFIGGGYGGRHGGFGGGGFGGGGGWSGGGGGFSGGGSSGGW